MSSIISIPESPLTAKTMSDLAIVTREVSKRYGEHEAVRGVSLEVRRGETFALLGPNGAGKTTLVEILEGNRRRTDGEASVLGEDPARAGRQFRARIGVVLQHSTDHATWHVQELVDALGGLYPNAYDSMQLLELVGLADRAAAQIRTLSGGQRRRLDVALGIVGRPELLFLDEPTTGFDPEARRELWNLLTQIKADGTTTLLTTHDLAEAEQLADRVGVLIDGKLVEVGDLNSLGATLDRRVRISWRGPNGREERYVDDVDVELTALRQQLGGEIPDLEVHRMSLEDTYLKIVEAHR